LRGSELTIEPEYREPIEVASGSGFLIKKGGKQLILKNDEYSRSNGQNGAKKGVERSTTGNHTD